MEEKQYIKLFNYGYYLSQHESEVLKKLQAGLETNTQEVNAALDAGRVQWRKDWAIEQLNSIEQSKASKENNLENEVDLNL